MAHYPRRRFGQNFLQDNSIINRVVEAVAPDAADHIVEIGPGRGALTYALQDQVRLLDLIELDRDLANILRTNLARPASLPPQHAKPSTKIRVHQADALRFDFSEILTSSKLRIVGNLPYNISTPLLFHLLKYMPNFTDLHLMLQREVAERMTAKPGRKEYGRLSVMVQTKCDVQVLFVVPPTAFFPVPKVDSALVRITPRTSITTQIADRKRFEQLVNRAFSQRRKTLRNSLKGVVDLHTMSTLGIDADRRPETLSFEEFAALSNGTGRNQLK